MQSKSKAGGFTIPAPVQRFGPAVLLMAIVLVAFFPATSAGFIWDDDDHVEGNPSMRSLEGLGRIWIWPVQTILYGASAATPQYYPVTFTSFWLEYRIWNGRPAGYHWTNILLHGLNAILVWRVLVVLQVPGAWLAAAVFAVHPVHVESVAWISERKNLLSTLFYGLALLAALRFFSFRSRAEPAGARSKLSTQYRAPSTEYSVRGPQSAPKAAASEDAHRTLFYALALILFFAALASKTVTFSLPAAILLILWWKRGTITRAELLALIPFFILAVVMPLITVFVERDSIGATGEPWDFSALERVLIAGRALWFYAGKLIWPANLTFFYPRWEINTAAWWQYLFPLAFLVAVACLWLGRRRLGRGPLVGVLFFAGTLFPALGFFKYFPMLFSFVADHFQYLASVGLITLFASAMARLFGRLRETGRILTVILAPPLLVILGLLTLSQCYVYTSLDLLYQDTIEKNPEAWIAHYNLGIHVLKDQQFGKAEEHFRRTLKLYPRLPEHRPDIGAALHLNLGIVAAWRRRYDEALEHFLTVMKLDPKQAEPHLNLGIMRAGQNRQEEAIEHFAKALELNSDHAVAHYEMGRNLSALGENAEAIEHLSKAASLMPGSAAVYTELGLALEKNWQTEEAIKYFMRAVELAPQIASHHYNLGVALRRLGRPGGLFHLGEAHRLDPKGYAPP